MNDMPKDPIDSITWLGCPWCGEQPHITKHHKHDVFSLVHRCSVFTTLHIDWTSLEAIGHQWNTRKQPDSEPTQVKPPICSICNWTNVSLLNCGNPGEPRWVCHGCCKRATEPVSDRRVAFAEDYKRLKEIWSEKSSWERDAQGESRADRAYNGLIWSSVALCREGCWSKADQSMLEAAQAEYAIIIRHTIYQPNTK